MAPASKTTPAVKKIVKKPTEGRKRRKTRHETFSIYIYKVLKQVHPEIGISKKAMNIMNSFINDIFDRLSGASTSLVRYNRKRTLSSREI